MNISLIRDGVRSLQRQAELRESLVRDLRQELLIGLRRLMRERLPGSMMTWWNG